MIKDLEGCQYSVCCHNDEYQKLQEQLSQLQQEIEKLTNKYQTYIKNISDNMKIVKDMTEQNFQIYEKDIIRVWNKFNCYQEFIKDLSKLKESDKNESK